MRFYILLIAIIALAACGFDGSDSVVEKTKSELESANQKIEKINLLLKEKTENLERVIAENTRLTSKSSTLEAENIRLSAEGSELQDKLNRLEIEFTGLSTRFDELDIWSKKLADGYGTGIWYMDESDRPIFVMPMKNSDITGVIHELNKRLKAQDLPGIILNEIDGKTAYIGTDNDEFLTQRMGSFGARSYINAVTYSITSIKDIDCIWLGIKEGDHALPGEYCR